MFSFQWQCKTIDNTEGGKQIQHENLLQYSNTYNKCVLLSLCFIMKIVNNTIPINTWNKTSSIFHRVVRTSYFLNLVAEISGYK